jgi:hypothetical protein
VDQLRAFSENIGSTMDRGALSASASTAAVGNGKKKRAPTASVANGKKKKKRKKSRYHSNKAMAQKDDGYLVFPLTVADLNTAGKFTQRRKLAYCRALGVKGKGIKIMGKLEEHVGNAGEMGCARPETASGGIPWSEWYTEQ